MTLTCPHCHVPVAAEIKLSTLEKAKTRLFESTGQWIGKSAGDLQRVENTYVPPTIPHSPVVATMPGSRETPVRAPTIESDVLVPLAHATVPAIAAAILLWLAWIRIGWEKPLFFTLAFFFSIAVIVWLWERQSWHSLLWKLEKWTGVDVNKDSQIGKPSAVDNRQVWVTIKGKDGGEQSRYSVLSPTGRALVADAIRNGGDFSRRSLCPDCIPENRYGQLRKAWLELGMIQTAKDYGDREVPKNADVELTRKGREFLELVPPTPEN